MKVLIIRFSSLGDVILATSVIQPLYEKGYNIDFLTLKPFGSIFEKDYRLKNVYSPEKSALKSIASIKSFAESLDKYDFIIDLHSNLRSFLITKFLKGKILRYRKNSIKRRLYTKPVFRKFINDCFNVLEAYSEPLYKMGFTLGEIPKPQVIITEEEKEKAKKILPDNFIAVGAGARYKNKAYPFFDRVSEILNKKGFNVVLLGTKEDKERDIGKYTEKVIDLRGKLSIRESIAAISFAKITISNDSAIAHMSRAVGTPVFVIYGATHPYFGFYPLKEEGSYICLNLPCQPCDLHGKKECKRKDTACLRNISPEKVVENALNLL